MSANPAHRDDIDGLRAVAVLGVVLYHYGATWLPGGFTGVDVFFVISGYVITLTLRRQIEAGSFSLLGFYDSRLRRILPALLVMLAVSICVGWFLLIPGDYADLGESAVYAAFGLGNFYFAANTGYFDQSADLLPLIHTWSLGVEEQFYFVWPIALFAALSVIKSRRVFLGLLTTAVVVAFAYAAATTAIDPNAAFYFPLPRAWELAIGALLVFVPPVRSRVIGVLLSFAGLCLITWSFLAISKQSVFPGFNALYACLGAAALIWSKPTNHLSASLSWRPVVFVGLISYSLYLWHWPVLIFYRHYNNGTFPAPVEAVVLFAVALLLAIGSWRFIEAPFRRMGTGARPAVVGMGIAAAAIVAIPSAIVAFNSGFQSRVPAEVEAMSSLDTMWQWDCETRRVEQLDGDYCVFGAPWETASSWGILWGDSHAEHAAPLIEQTAKDEGVSFVLFRTCPAAVGGRVQRVWQEVPNYVAQCQEAQEKARRALQVPRFRSLVLAASWNPLTNVVSSDVITGTGQELVLTGLTDLVSQVARPGLSIVLLDQMPAFSIDPASCWLAEISGMLRRQCVDLEANGFRTSVMNESSRFLGFDLLADTYGVKVVHPRETMCSESSCITEINGEFLFRDGNHIRRNLSPKTLNRLADWIGLTSAVHSN